MLCFLGGQNENTNGDFGVPPPQKNQILLIVIHFSDFASSIDIHPKRLRFLHTMLLCLYTKAIFQVTVANSQGKGERKEIR